MISFDKMHGNGNDFIVLNSIDNTHKLSKSRIKKLSDRNFGIGFDLVILIAALLELFLANGKDFSFFL